MRAALSSFWSDSPLYGVAPPVCRWPQRLKPASSSAMTEFRSAVLRLLCTCSVCMFKCQFCLGFLVSLFFISSMAIDFVVRDLVGGHGQQYRGVETGPLVFSASLHLHQTHQFQVSIVAWKFNCLSGTVFTVLMPFDLSGSRRLTKCQMTLIRVKNSTVPMEPSYYWLTPQTRNSWFLSAINIFCKLKMMQIK